MLNTAGQMTSVLKPQATKTLLDIGALVYFTIVVCDIMRCGVVDRMCTGRYTHWKLVCC